MFFSMNHTNYARWMPVHVRDMCALETMHPDVASEFRKGKFVMSKSHRKFSQLSIDHAHEQNNRVMKEEGRIIGLTHDADAMLKWAVSGPELIRVISEFEASMIEKDEKPITCHHEQTIASQRLCVKQVHALITTLEGMGNALLRKTVTTWYKYIP